jgi:hypothetical protein
LKNHKSHTNNNIFIDQNLLDSLNVEQMKDENRKALDGIGGPDGMIFLTKRY